MNSPYVSWYQVPKGYSKPKPFTEMFMMVKNGNMETVYEHLQFLPVALFVNCGCDLQKKLTLDRDFETHCDNNDLMPNPLDLSVIKDARNQPFSCNNSDVKGETCQASDSSTNILSGDNKENCLSNVSLVEPTRVQNVQNSDSSSHQLKVEKTDDVVVSTNTSAHILDNDNEHSLPKKERSSYSEVQKRNMKPVNTKQLNGKIMRLRRRWIAKSASAIKTFKTLASFLISLAQRQLFRKKKKNLHYRAPCQPKNKKNLRHRALRQPKKKSVLCQTTSEIERIVSSSPRTCTSNVDSPNIDAGKVSQEILSSTYDPFLSNNISRIAQETYFSNPNSSSSNGYPIIVNNTERSRLNNGSDSSKASLPEISLNLSAKLLSREKEMSTQDFSVLMDLDGFSTDKLLDLLSVEHDVFSNVPNELENFGLFFPPPNCGVSHVGDEDMYISNVDVKDRNREDKASNSVLTATSKMNHTNNKCMPNINVCDEYQSLDESMLNNNIPSVESQTSPDQLYNLKDTVDVARKFVPNSKAGVKHGATLIPEVAYETGRAQNDENNNSFPILSEECKKIAKNDIFIAKQEKTVAEIANSSIANSTDKKYRQLENSRKRRDGGTLSTNKINKRLKNHTDFVKDFKAGRKIQHKISPLKNDDQKKREGKMPKSFIKKYPQITRTSSKRQRTLCYCEKNVPTSLADISSCQETDNKTGLVDTKQFFENRKEYINKNNERSLKVQIPLSDLNKNSNQTNDIVGKIISESTAKMIDLPTLLRARNSQLITKQKNKPQSKSSIDLTFLPGYIPPLLKNPCPSLTPVHEPVYNFPSQSTSVTVPIARKKTPAKESGNSLIRDPRLRSRKRRKSQDNEEEGQKNRVINANDDEIRYPNVSVSKEDLERNTFLITEILRDSVCYGTNASFGIALFNSEELHPCLEM